MKKLFNYYLSPKCEYCRFGRLSPDSSSVLCIKHGIMMPDSSCGSFKYDALKRRPKIPAKIFSDFSEDEFNL